MAYTPQYFTRNAVLMLLADQKGDLAMDKKLMKKLTAAVMAFALIGGAVNSPMTGKTFIPTVNAEEAASSGILLPDDEPCCSFDEETGVLTLSERVVKDEVREYALNEKVKKVVCKEGTVFPEDCSGLFNEFKAEEIDLSNADGSNISTMSGTFYCCTGLKSVVFGNFDTSKVVSLSAMFRFCGSLKSVDLSGLDFGNVINTNHMFSNCYDLEYVNMSNFDSSNVSDMSFMFLDCNNLRVFDIGNFAASEDTDMRYMFFSCRKLESLDLRNVHTNKESYDVDTAGMISDCTALEKDICYVAGTSVTLDSNIGVNIYLTPCENLAKVVMSGPNGDITFIDFSELQFNMYDDLDTLKFTYSLNATQSSETVTLKAFDKNDRQLIICKTRQGQPSSCSQISCTVREYLDKLLNTPMGGIGGCSYGSELGSVIKTINALINYINAADNYFNGTDYTVNGIDSYDNHVTIYTEDKIIEKEFEPLDSFKPEFGDDIKLSLVLNSATSLRIYTESNDVKLYGNNMTQKMSKYGKYYEISNIPAHKLCDRYPVTINGVDYEISPMSYVYRVLNNDNANQKLKDMANAAYIYASVSNTYHSFIPKDIWADPNDMLFYHILVM